MKRSAGFLILLWLASAASGQSETAVRTPTPTQAHPPKVADVPEPQDPRLVSPYGTVLRSVVLPGWGQIHIREPIQGLAFLAGVGGLTAAWVIAYRDFRQQYDDVYLPEVKRSGVSSPEANAIYSDVNRRFKTSRFLLFSTLGVWGYSLIDAYVDANIYNAEIRAEDVIEEGKEIRRLQLGWRRNAPFLRYRIAF